MSAAMRSMPVESSATPKVSLSTAPVTGSVPTQPKMSPMQAAVQPHRRSPPDMAATHTSPKSPKLKYSTEVNLRASPESMGAKNRRMSPDARPPTKDPVVARLSAREASPFLAMAWPSRAVAELPGAPGVLTRMAGMEPAK